MKLLQLNVKQEILFADAPTAGIKLWYICQIKHIFPQYIQLKKKNRQVLVAKLHSDNILSRLTLCINVGGEVIGNWDSGVKAPKRDHRSNIHVGITRTCMQ